MSRDRRTPSRIHCPSWRWLRLVGIVGLLLPQAFGCRSTAGDRRYELIEAELRTRERELAEARAELNGLRGLSRAYQRPALGPAPTDFAGLPFLPIKDITLGSGTGGADDDDIPGDESLQVVVIPRDDDASAVKVPATLEVIALEITRTGQKVPIGRWQVTPEQLRRTWKSGLFATGYFVPLQWDVPPSGNRVRLAVKLQTLDGRCFETDKDVSVRPVVGASDRPQPAWGLAGGPGGLGGPGIVPEVGFPPGSELPPPAELRAEKRPLRVRSIRADD